MKNNSLIFTLTLMISLMSTSCETELPYDSQQLNGRWEIQEARRNGRVTQSLEGAFFEFRSDGSMLTNLMGKEEEHPYELQQKGILQKSQPKDILYKIDELSDSKLGLSMTIRKFDFQLKLDKTKTTDPGQ